MATQLLAIAKTAASSADIVVTAAAPVTVALKITSGESFPRGALVSIMLKDDGAAYGAIGLLDALVPVTTLTGPGTYRLDRANLSDPNSSGVGAFSA